MAMRIFCIAALTFGLSFAAQADQSAKPDATKTKAKTGDACKTSADCDQSGNRQACRANKCQLEPIAVPTT